MLLWESTQALWANTSVEQLGELTFFALLITATPATTEATASAPPPPINQMRCRVRSSAWAARSVRSTRV